jgi:ribonuclease HI
MSDPVLTIHTDGASRGNPGDAAYAYTIEGDSDVSIEEAGCLGKMTNNQAEYTALVRALEHALRLGPAHHLVVHSDSELMVKQMKGEYKVKNEELRDLYQQALRLAGKFKQVTLKHVRREHNKRADQLCNDALDGKREASAEALIAASLDGEAIACLKAAGAGPDPAAVWKKLLAVLAKHGVTVPR